MLYPIAWMFISAFKASAEVMSMPPRFIPDQPTLENFYKIYQANFVKYTLNSVFVSLMRTAIPLYTSALLGYIFDKFEFKGKNFVFVAIISTMMVPWIVTIIPLYNLISSAKLLNSYTALILPFIFSSYGIFLVKSFMHSIPNSLMESARIDGCNEFSIFNRIILPLTGPALSAMGILLFLAAWDDYLWPFLTINSDSKFTITIGLAKFAFTMFMSQYGPVLAGSVVAVLPMLIVYFVLQKYIIEGISLTGVKG